MKGGRRHDFHALFLSPFSAVVGAVLVFGALGVELAVLIGAARAKDARPYLEMLKINRVVGPVSMLLLLIPGIVMTVTTWGWAMWWIRAAFIGLIAIGALGGAVTGRTVGVITQRLSDAAPTIDARAFVRLRASFFARAGIALAVVFVMAMKPNEVALAFGTLIAGACLGLVPLLSGAKSTA